ncbi:aspartoacylase [Sphaerospermopsis aphanizomenoides BCCUSP55]|uniref:aspartoacylase n=1 Tax=Sphaerospermopsis aphanizomenoides TaxID=459663 RepID=UPI0019051C0D|nr:aspartoacylase [Sphaerospermopsis aphanizomenoides]MBK1986708.1 aspartoacylase [Sphaerospermopsis aphanizomenoides BCCUSP55]
MTSISRVAVMGGIHGNEVTGVYLIKKFQKYPHLISRPSFETLPLLGNPQAIVARRRYIDTDLNRCFTGSDLSAKTPDNYEQVRAREIQQILQPQNQNFVDAIIDLHTTTANMGLCIILGNMHPLLLRLAANLSAINPLVKVYSHLQPRNSGFLRSLSELGFAIEVGAVSPGILNAELFQQTEQLVYSILDYFEQYNRGKDYVINNTLTLYQSIGAVDYPRDEDGEIEAMIHPQLQFQDYEPLHPGDPIFLTFENKEILYQGESIVYPIFINEAAYYEKGIAMYLSQKQVIDIY